MEKTIIEQLRDWYQINRPSHWQDQVRKQWLVTGDDPFMHTLLVEITRLLEQHKPVKKSSRLPLKPSK